MDRNEPLKSAQLPTVTQEGVPWDIYRTTPEHVTVLEGNYAFNSRMRVLLNGTTTKNGEPMPSPVEVAGIVRAVRLNDALQTVFLKAEDGQRSADIYMELGKKE